ncbi:iron chaperone [Alteromonas halophila]|uniref:YdhG-like domain-containing protein n=1 Tax=Alteromonas halophila TaxID=516698 RepID=A0A918MV84_9ALTE|nr:DUF1801 domain-containing protein [Alteromonas halophila]GGW76127.1 hypothetical protein GCM10007391_05770 [Alteromonas halophila]
MQDVSHYIEGQPEDRRLVLRQLVELIEAQAPDVSVSMKYKMPTFEREGHWIAVGNLKHCIALYTREPAHIAEFKRKHPKVKTGEGCINFTRMDSIPYKDLETVIDNALALH